jgi:hypothetical protein
MYVIADAGKQRLQVSLDKVSWRIPHVSVNDIQRLRFLKILKEDPWLPIGFMSWELHEYPLLNQTDRHTWTIKTAPQLHTPRYVILAFQTDRKNNLGRDSDRFDNINLQNAKLYLNGIPFPYDNLNVDFDSNRITTLYMMYSQFQNSYYGLEESNPLLKLSDFKTGVYMLVVFNCAHQPEAIKGGSVDVRLEFETKTPVADKTSAFCLILHDSIVNYQPVASSVQIL